MFKNCLCLLYLVLIRAVSLPQAPLCSYAQACVKLARPLNASSTITSLCFLRGRNWAKQALTYVMESTKSEVAKHCMILE